MNFEKTIKKCMDYYGIIYPYRKSVLNQLFAVNGNGYEWIDGELVDKDAYDIPLKEFKHKEILEHMATLIRFDIFNKLQKKTPKQLYRLAKKKLKERVKNNPFKKEKTDWYPMSKGYCKMYPFPDNIKDDWLEGIIETCQYIIEDNGSIGDLPFEELPEGYEKTRTLQNLEIAKTVLKKATKLKKDRLKNKEVLN